MVAADLRGAHAVVTGGSSGIGLATARALARRGCRVSLLARGEARLATAAGALRRAGATVATRSVDVADASAVDAAVGEVTDELGPCRVLVTSAGIARPGHFLDLDDEHFRRQMDVNYFGTLHAIRAVVGSMVAEGAGHVIAISSAAGLVGIYGYTAYAPTKFAVRGLCESLRAELAPAGVHVGCVYPPDVDTPQLAEEERYKPAQTRAIAGTIRPLPPARVADAILAGIDRRKATIIPDASTKLLSRTVGPLREVYDRFFDRAVSRTEQRQRPKP